MENSQQDGAIQFLDTTVKPEADDTLSLTVYKKPTHTDQHLQWGSQYNLVAKYSVMPTLTYRAKTICTKPQLLNRKNNT